MFETAKMSIEDVGGGSRQDLPASSVPDNAFLQIKNMEYDHTGALVTRGGQSEFNATAFSGTGDNGIRFYRPSSNVVKTIVASFTGVKSKVFVADDNAGTFAEVTGGTALTDAKPMSFLSFRDTLFMVNGVETMQYFTNGTTKADCVFSDNNVKGKYIATASNRVFVAGDPSAKNTVYYSDDSLFTVGPGTDCSFPGYIRIEGEKNDYIIGLMSLGDYCFIWRRRDVFRIDGAENTNTITRTEVLTGLGATNQRGICSTPYGFVFCSDTSVWMWDGNSNPVDLGVFVSDTISGAVFDTAVCEYIPTLNTVYVSFKASSTSTVNDYGLSINFGVLQNGIPTVVENTIGANAFISCDGAGDNRYVYRVAPDTTGTSKGKIYRLNTGTDDAGVDFTATLKTKNFSFQDADVIKIPRTIRIGMYAQASTTPVVITAILDRGASSNQLSAYTVTGFNKWGQFIWGQAKWGGGLYQTATIHVDFGLQGREIQLQFTVSNGVPLKLYRYSVEFQTLPLRGR